MIHYGIGILNKIINKLPVELHISNYHYCGPGTRLEERLARRDPGINHLDSARKEHDIAYSQYRDNIEKRNIADKVLAEKAWSRVKAKDSSLKEKAAAFVVAYIMETKSKLGMGMSCRKKKKNDKRGKELSFRTIVNAAKKGINEKSRNSQILIKSALAGAQKIDKKKFLSPWKPEKLFRRNIYRINEDFGLNLATLESINAINKFGSPTLHLLSYAEFSKKIIEPVEA